MNKKILIVILTLVSITGFSQKAQKIGYLDMEYILENVPEYKTAQSKLDAKVNNWNGKLAKIKNEIEKLEANLNNEKALLTDDLIKDREEDIQIKKEEYKALQETYFGPSGELFLLRKQIVKPVQDQIYNAVQEIAKTKKYDMILDKSSDLLMLYTNKKFDVSELVLNKIVKGRKLKQNEQKKKQRIASTLSKQEQMKLKIKERKEKQEALKLKIKKAREAKKRRTDSIRKAKIAERLEKVNKIKNRQKGSADNKVNNATKKEEEVSEDVKTASKENASKIKEEETKKEPAKKTAAQLKLEQREKKRIELQNRIKNQKRKRDSLKQAAADRRAKRLKEIEERKKKLQNNN